MFCKRHIKGKINVVISTVLLDQCYAVSSKNFEHIANLVYTYLIFDNKMAMAVSRGPTRLKSRTLDSEIN